MATRQRFISFLATAPLALLLLAGCASTPPRLTAGASSASALARQPAPVKSGARTAAEAPELAEEVVLNALSLIGVPYRWGGSHPNEGLDCSGLVQWVYRGAANLQLPRRSDEMMSHGHPVSSDSLRAGDLVFFNTLQRTGSHVGIYIGRGRFVHAPNARGVVRIESLDQIYWASRFDGARRLIPDTSRDALIADRREP